MKDRMARIKEKGFQMTFATDTDERYVPTDFGKIKVGLKTLDDAIISYGTVNKVNPRLGTKDNVLKAMNNGDLEQMRSISNYF